MRFCRRWNDVPRHDPDVHLHLEQFGSSLARWLSTGEAFVAQQNALATALQSLQDKSPNLVKQLRERGFATESRAVFAIALDTIEYATGQGAVDENPLRERIEEVRKDAAWQTGAPEMTAEFLDTVDFVVEQGLVAELTLASIENSTIGADLAELNGALANFNRGTVSRAETARILMSVCAVLLLIGVGYSLYRLQIELSRI